MKNKLFSNNFLMIVAGQLVSIFGNSVLRFALPLYILDETGSMGIFGTVLALSSVPVILFSPVGGILADRVNKRNMMVILDTITAVIIAGFCMALGSSAIVIMIAVMMVLMSLIQSIYQPIVQACIPVVAHEDNLERANAVVSLVNAFSNLMAPVAAGFLYGTYGINIIMIVGSISFALAAFMELFIKVKVSAQSEHENIGEMIKADFKESAHYILKDNPMMLKAMVVVGCINLFFTSMIVVGLPAMIKIKLGLSSQLYGTTQGMLAVGMILGGILTSALGKRIDTKKVHILLMLISVSLLPIGLSFMMNLPVMITYWVISICCLVMMTIVTIFSITMMSFVQRETPKHLIGKVLSYVLVLTQCSLPVGQALFGCIFEVGMNYISMIVFITAIISGSIALYSKYIFGSLANKKDFEPVEYDGSLQYEYTTE